MFVCLLFVAWAEEGNCRGPRILCGKWLGEANVVCQLQLQPSLPWNGRSGIAPSPPKTLRLLSSERRRGTGMEKTASFFLPEKHEMMFPQDLKYEQVSSICRRNQISVPSLPSPAPASLSFFRAKFSLQSFPLSPLGDF